MNGFYITSGNANGSEEYGKGGGVYFGKSFVNITNCIITGNRANKGGGLYAFRGVFYGCVISNNEALEGGGLYARTGILKSAYFLKILHQLEQASIKLDKIENTIFSKNNAQHFEVLLLGIPD